MLGAKQIHPMADFRLMADTARSMVHDALDAFIDKDIEKARGVTSCATTHRGRGLLTAWC